MLFFFSHLTLCPSMSSLFPFFPPSNSTIVEIQTYVESEKRSAFLIPFFSERSWGLVCAWVPRIMITAAEKHIFTFQEIRAGNLQAEDLTSSLWLIVELTEKSQPNANTRLHPCTTRKNTHYYVFHCEGYQSLWHSGGTCNISNDEASQLTVPVSNFLLKWLISHHLIKSGFISHRETKSNISLQRWLDVEGYSHFQP